MFELIWAGWYKSGTSDKIWGIVKVNNSYYNFWCRRGSKMNFKGTHSIKYNHKEDKGYKSINHSTLCSIYQNFDDELINNLIFKIVDDKIF